MKRPPKPRALERDLQSTVVDALSRINGIKVRRCQGGKQIKVKGGYMQLMEPGTPDLEVLLPGGLTCHIELKKDATEKLDPDQERVHAELRAMGHAVGVFWEAQPAIDFVVMQKAAADALRQHMGDSIKQLRHLFFDAKMPGDSLFKVWP